MALTHLVDTSVLTRLSAEQIADRLRPMMRSGQLARAQITDLELGFQARSAAEWDAIQASLTMIEPLDLTAEDGRRALTVQRLLASESQRGRKVPDLLIAAVAERQGLAVMHYDRDFDLISAVTGQRTEWVTPAGSID